MPCPLLRLRGPGSPTPLARLRFPERLSADTLIAVGVVTVGDHGSVRRPDSGLFNIPVDNIYATPIPRLGRHLEADTTTSCSYRPTSAAWYAPARWRSLTPIWPSSTNAARRPTSRSHEHHIGDVRGRACLDHGRYRRHRQHAVQRRSASGDNGAVKGDRLLHAMRCCREANRITGPSLDRWSSPDTIPLSKAAITSVGCVHRQIARFRSAQSPSKRCSASATKIKFRRCLPNRHRPFSCGMGLITLLQQSAARQLTSAPVAGSRQNSSTLELPKWQPDSPRSRGPQPQLRAAAFATRPKCRASSAWQAKPEPIELDPQCPGACPQEEDFSSILTTDAQQRQQPGAAARCAISPIQTADPAHRLPAR